MATQTQIMARIKKYEKQYDTLEKTINTLQKGFNGTKSAKEESALSRKIDSLAEKQDAIDNMLSQLYFAKDHLRETRLSTHRHQYSYRRTGQVSSFLGQPFQVQRWLCKGCGAPAPKNWVPSKRQVAEAS